MCWSLTVHILETIENIIQMPNYESHILDCLLQENDIHHTLSTPLVGHTTSINAAERQRRAIILCVFKLIRPWQRYYKSLVEVGLVFWSIYRYFMVRGGRRFTSVLAQLKSPTSG